ncbi:MAG: YceI family protein [Deltaproteobacteria bacterium]|nr:YceI family protein [Deltaproteobacteria bacterium]
MFCRSTVLTALLALGVATPAHAEDPATWELDQSHFAVGFSVRHMMISNVKGEFTKAQATLTYDGQDVTKAVVEASVEVTSITTKNAKRDAHLKSPDFFDAAKHPKLTFKSTKVRRGFRGQLKVTGELTIRGVTKPLELAVMGLGKPIKDMMGKSRVGIQAAGKISRKEFGMTWNKTLDKGGLVVGDDVFITLDAEFIRKESGAAAAK